MTTPTLLLLIAAGVGLTLVGAVIVLGLTLPATRAANASAVIPAAPERVWQVITTVADQPRWRPEITAVSGDQTAWTETDKRGTTIAFRSVSSTPHQRWELAFEGPGFHGTWIGQLTPAPGGCRFEIQETVTTPGLMLRIMGRLFFSPQEFVERYLRELAAAVPAHGA